MWKTFFEALAELRVLSLPTRDGNSLLKFNRSYKRTSSFEPTYKGWKFVKIIPSLIPSRGVLSLPTRDGNIYQAEIKEILRKTF